MLPKVVIIVLSFVALPLVVTVVVLSNNLFFSSSPRVPSETHRRMIELKWTKEPTNIEGDNDGQLPPMQPLPLHALMKRNKPKLEAAVGRPPIPHAIRVPSQNNRLRPIFECFWLSMTTYSPTFHTARCTADGKVVVGAHYFRPSAGNSFTDKIFCERFAVQGDCMLPASARIALLPRNPLLNSERNEAIFSRYPVLPNHCTEMNFLGINSVERSGEVYYVKKNAAELATTATPEVLVHSDCFFQRQPHGHPMREQSEGSARPPPATGSLRHIDPTSIAAPPVFSPEEIIALLRVVGQADDNSVPKILITGDSMMRQFFLRLIEYFRSNMDPASVSPPVVEHFQHCDSAYILYQTTSDVRDRLGFFESDEHPGIRHLSVEDYFATWTATLPPPNSKSWKKLLEIHFLWDSYPSHPRVVWLENSTAEVALDPFAFHIGRSYGIHIVSYMYWWRSQSEAEVMRPMFTRLMHEAKFLHGTQKRKTIFVTTAHLPDDRDGLLFNHKFDQQTQIVQQLCTPAVACYFLDFDSIVRKFEGRPPPFTSKNANETAKENDRRYRCDGVHFTCTFTPEPRNGLLGFRQLVNDECQRCRCRDDVNLAAWQWLVHGFAGMTNK